MQIVSESSPLIKASYHEIQPADLYTRKDSHPHSICSTYVYI